jgi:hypothetical protein
MTTFNWNIATLYTLQQPDPNYVVTAFWFVDGIDGDYSARVCSQTSFDSTQSGTFIPYDQLTEEIVIGWVQASMGTEGVTDVEAAVQKQIDLLKNPPEAPQSQPLPWAQQGAQNV